MRETQCLLIQGMSFLIDNASLDMSVQINEYALECSGSWNLDLLLQKRRNGIFHHVNNSVTRQISVTSRFHQPGEFFL